MNQDVQRWQRIGAIFDAAVDLAPAERVRMLDTLCADDAELRTEVESLLRADDAATAFERDAVSARNAAAADWVGGTGGADASGGQRIGPWRISREIGRGGMGVVLLAERADGQYEQRAALKLIKRGMDSEAILARFLRERQILARLAHPHIARLLDGGIGDDGRPYFAMEFVEGKPLLDYCATKNMKLEERIGLFLDVCAAVQFAHGQLIVHRDIKPSNILVDVDGNAKLLDFGIAKVLDDSSPGATATSDMLHRPLTPAYAAPEQLRGEPVSIATDIYALGCVLYELLTGRRPLAAGDAPTPEEMLRLQSTTDPSAPSKTVVDGMPVSTRHLRGDLDTIVLKALQREPTRRYGTVAAFADDLQRHLAGQPIMARRDHTAYRFGKFVNRHRVGVALGAAAIVALLVATAISLYEVRIGRAQTLQARAQAQRAQAQREFLVGVFGQVSPDENKGQPITAKQLLETGEREIDKDANHQPALKAELFALLGKLYRDIGDRPHGQALIDRALTGVETAGVPDDVRARILLSAAESESEDKETFDAALLHARQGVALLEALPDRDPQAFATGHVRIAYALRRKGSDDQAAELLHQVIPKDTQALGNRHEAVAEEWVQFGIALSNLHRFDESGAAFENALKIYRDLYGADSAHVSHTLDAMAGMLYDKADYAGAERNYRDALKISTSRRGPNDHDTLVDRGNLLKVLEFRGEFAEALTARLDLLAQAKASGQLTPTDLANDYLGTSIDYIETSHFAEGEKMIRDAMTTLRETKGTHSAWYAFALEFLGYVLPWQGRYAEAESALREALAITLEKDTPTSASASACRLRDSLSWVLVLEHRYADALVAAQQVNADCTPHLAQTSLQRPTFLADLSAAQLDSGNAAGALATANDALAIARKVYPQAYYRLGVPLLALARAELALERAHEAEPLLREALAVRSPLYAADDPRLLEVEVELVETLGINGKHDEADVLKAHIEPLIKGSSSAYLQDLQIRMQTH